MTKKKLGYKDWLKKEYPNGDPERISKRSALNWCIKKYEALQLDVLAKYGLKICKKIITDSKGHHVHEILGCQGCPLCKYYLNKIQPNEKFSHPCCGCPISVYAGTICDRGAWIAFSVNNDAKPMLDLLLETKRLILKAKRDENKKK